jgi:hypothetical protein
LRSEQTNRESNNQRCRKPPVPLHADLF